MNFFTKSSPKKAAKRANHSSANSDDVPRAGTTTPVFATSPSSSSSTVKDRSAFVSNGSHNPDLQHKNSPSSASGSGSGASAKASTKENATEPPRSRSPLKKVFSSAAAAASSSSSASAAAAKHAAPVPTTDASPHEPRRTSDRSKSSSAAGPVPAIRRPHLSTSKTGSRANSSRFSTHSASSRSYDPDEHPLNLPPEERKRYSSALSSTMSDPMDLDAPETPTSPLAQQSTPASAKSNGVGASEAAAANSNGVRSANGDGPPAPPEHRSQPTSPSPPQPTPEEAEEFKNAGNRFYKAKEYRKAIEQYTKAVEAVPTSATYLNNRAAAYISAGQYKLALEDSLAAAQIEPDSEKILLRLARVYINLGQPQNALDTFARIEPAPSAKDLGPAKAMLQHITVAEDALKNGTTGSMALHALDQAEKLLGAGAPKPRKWVLMRGEAYLKVGNVNALGEAQNAVMYLLRNNSQDPEALVLRGRILYAQGENEKALQHFRKALACDPDFKDAVKYLRMVQKLDRMKDEGNKEYKAGRYQSAVDKYTEALEVDPTNRGTNAKLLQNRALCRTNLKDYTGAIADCERAIQLEPSYTKARKTKATALGKSGNWEESVKEWKALAEADPNDASIAKDVAHAELELKKSKRKDYYKILGIEKDADENGIKKAYRKAAIVHHPDKNPDDEHAAERFKDISEAYETLSDPSKRARYDSGADLADPMDGFGGGMGGGVQLDPDILMSMFGAQMGGGGRGGPSFSGFGGMPGGGSGRRAQHGFPGGFTFQ